MFLWKELAEVVQMIMNKENLELLKEVPVSAKSENFSESKKAYRKGIERFDHNNY